MVMLISYEKMLNLNDFNNDQNNNSIFSFSE